MVKLMNFLRYHPLVEKAEATKGGFPVKVIFKGRAELEDLLDRGGASRMRPEHLSHLTEFLSKGSRSQFSSLLIVDCKSFPNVFAVH